MLYMVWSLIFLAICAVIDLKEQKVCTRLCLINAAVALMLHILLQDLVWVKVLLGMMLGALFYVISIFTNESIGKGDGIVIFTLGCMLGINKSFRILFWAAVLCSGIAIGGIVVRKLNLKSRIPFVPFLFVGSAITFIV